MNLYDITKWNAQTVCSARKEAGCRFCNMYDYIHDKCVKEEYLAKINQILFGD